MITDENKEKLKESLKEKITDINGDGEINIEILDYSISSEFKDIEFENAYSGMATDAEEGIGRRNRRHRTHLSNR